MATIVADPLHAVLHIPGPAGLRATVPGQWLKDALLTLTLFACLYSLRMRGRQPPLDVYAYHYLLLRGFKTKSKCTV